MEVEWDDDLSTGVGIIDNQHKNLINRIKKLAAAVNHNRAGLEVIQLIKFLEDYTRSHFSMEEKYMKKYKYPEIVFHVKQHREFIQTLNELRRLYSGQTRVDVEMAKHLQYELWQYFREHISVVDAVFADFLKKANAR
ncbi:bacteriohemerythrin [candidate division KSB1 bacterium]